MSEIHSRELGAIYTRSSAITVCQLFFPLRRYLSQIGHLPVIVSVNYQIITGDSVSVLFNTYVGVGYG